MRRKTIIVSLVAATACVLAVGGVLLVKAEGRRQANFHWRQSAVADVKRLSGDRSWLDDEIGSLVAGPERALSKHFMSDNMISMTNGEWLVYRNVCTKEDARLDDMFIARGSDGKWYYSTFHFCRGMIVLRDCGASISLREFAARYGCREFSGSSQFGFEESWP